MLYKKLYKKSLKQEKEAGTNFVLYGNMVEQFKRAYLYRPIKIFLTPTKNSKKFNITLNYFSFFNNNPPAS